MIKGVARAGEVSRRSSFPCAGSDSPSACGVNMLPEVQFLQLPGKGERFVVVPESLYRFFEEIISSQYKDKLIALQSNAGLPSNVLRELDLGVAPVRAIRKWRRLSAAKLARMVGVTPSMLSQIEARARFGSVRTYMKLSSVLGVPIELLLPEDIQDKNIL